MLVYGFVLYVVDTQEHWR